jgi:transposase
MACIAPNMSAQHLPRRAGHDMERLEKKRIKGHIYYYYSKWGRVNGKCRRLWQKYLGKPEDILHAVEGGGPRPQYAEVFHFGLAATFWQECQRANIIGHIDRHCPKREQGLSPGEYLALAALNRAIHPLSKSAMFDWFATTTLRRHFPQASKAAFASQRFWDHMDRLEPDMTLAIWKAIITEVIAREAIPLSSVCYDGTNFYTFIDTFNTQCKIAKRGKNKQGRSNLRQVSYALFCHADAQVPLYYEVYEGNRNDTKQFPVMIQKFHDFLTTSFGGHIDAPQVTLIFDKGNNSKENFRLIGTLKLHYVGSIKLCEVKELAEISNQDSRLTPCQTIGLEKTKCFRVTQEIYGKERTMIVTYNQPLFHTQYLTLHNDIAKAITALSILQQKLLDRAAGLIKGGQCPTVASITKQCQTILHRQYMKSIITYTVEQGDKNVPQLAYGIDHTVLNNLSDTYLGKNIMVTDREHWSNEKIILAYRSQFNIENVFKEMKDRDIGSWWPLYHWTDQKISVHGFYCTIALLLRALAYRRVKEAGIAISMKRLIAELDDIKEVILLYPRKRGTKTAWHHTVLSKTSELQQSLLSILQVNTEEIALLG